MTYPGTFRLDLGPFVPVGPSISSICENGVRGISCRLATMDFGRISAICFDAMTMVDIMDYAEDNRPISRLLTPLFRDGRFFFDIHDEDARDGIMGFPLRAVPGRMRAFALHGTVTGFYRSGDGRGVIIAEACGLQVMVAVPDTPRKGVSFGGIRRDSWAVFAGYGTIGTPRPERREWTWSIDDLLFAYPAEDSPPVFGAAGKSGMDAFNSFWGNIK